MTQPSLLSLIAFSILPAATTFADQTIAGQTGADATGESSGSVGIRAGWDAESQVDLTEISVYAISPAWKTWSLGETSAITLSFEGQIGNLHGEGEDSVFASIAPTVAISCTEFPLSIYLSSGPAYYSEDQFGDFDLGSNFQFISSAGVEFSVTEHWAVGYRFQHTSNAGLSDPNPGVNMHLLSAAYHF